MIIFDIKVFVSDHKNIARHVNLSPTLSFAIFCSLCCIVFLMAVLLKPSISHLCNLRTDEKIVL